MRPPIEAAGFAAHPGCLPWPRHWLLQPCIDGGEADLYGCMQGWTDDPAIRFTGPRAGREARSAAAGAGGTLARAAPCDGARASPCSGVGARRAVASRPRACASTPGMRNRSGTPGARDVSACRRGSRSLARAAAGHTLPRLMGLPRLSSLSVPRRPPADEISVPRDEGTACADGNGWRSPRSRPARRPCA